MLSNSSISPPVFSAETSAGRQKFMISNLQDLNSFAVQGLVPMFNGNALRFCQRLVKTEKGMVQQGISDRYTIICLLGLWQMEKNGFRMPFNLHAILDSFLGDTKWLESFGDLGLLIWLVAQAAPDRLEETMERFSVKSALERFPAAREGNTTELAWFLTGLAEAALVSLEEKSSLDDLAQTAFREVKQNQGKSGLFRHLHRRKSWKGILRGRIGNFADQVYPIYAFSRFAQAYGNEEALESARLCARGIIREQGHLGQWWWLYDSASGKVVRRYPVYSVHQEGMGPMALFALSEVSRDDLSDPIYKGLRWISGENELHENLCDPSSTVIWRCIRARRLWTMYFNDFRNFLSGSHAEESGPNLNVLYECWPYELGWLLYAFAGRSHGQALSKSV